MTDQVDELKSILFEVSDWSNNNNNGNKYHDYEKLEKELDVTNKKQLSDKKKFEREF